MRFAVRDLDQPNAPNVLNGHNAWKGLTQSGDDSGKKPYLILEFLFSNSSLATINNDKILSDILWLYVIYGVKK